MRVVIVGNGVAGIEAAREIRAHDASCEIVIVSEESDHLFSRTALMWVVSGQLSLRDIEPYERDLYTRNAFQRLRARVVGLDTDKKHLQLADQQAPLAYDRLLIACGSQPRPGPWPGSDLRGVGHFVTLQDMAWLSEELFGSTLPRVASAATFPRASPPVDSPYRRRDVAATSRGRPPATGVVVGGGLIGIEAIEVMLARGLKPTFLIREDWFWPIAIDAREATWIADRLRDHGVDVRLAHEVTAFTGDNQGNVVATETSDGSLPTDIAVIAIGVMPNTNWLENAKIERDSSGGIVVDVDAGLTTSAPDVFAAGDCATVRWFDGRQRPEQLWYTARDQGRIAARALLGENARYNRGTWYNSAKLIDIEYTTAGRVNMNLPGEQNWFHEETGKIRSTSRIVVHEDRVVGFCMLGRRWDHRVLTRWIDQRQPLNHVLAHLHQAAFDTEFVPPLVLPA